MNSQSSPEAESARLAALQSYEILDTPPEAEFDDFTKLAAYICQSPVALISLVDRDRQWFKSKIGVDAEETPLDVSICRHAIRHDGLFIIPDTLQDPRTQDNPYVTSDPHFRFYAGARLDSSEGYPLGTICVLDSQPRELSGAQKQALEMLARQVMTAMELRSSRRRLHSTVESISDAFFTLDQELSFTYVNTQAEGILGRGRQDLLGSAITSACGLGREEQFMSRLRQVADSKAAQMFEAYLLTSRRWLDVRVYPAADGLTVYFQDVTIRKKKEEQLRLLEACVSRLNDIVIITEADLIDEPGPRIVYVNDAFVRHTGYTAAEAVGRSPRFLQGPKTQRAALERIREDLTATRPSHVELINYTKSGEEIWLQLDITPVQDSSGTVAHFVAIERDITARKKAEEELWRSEQEQRKLGQRLKLERARTMNARRDAKVGSWELDVVSQELIWTDELHCIFETDPATFHPTREKFFEFVHPLDRATVENATQFSLQQRSSCAVEYRALMPDGRIKNIEQRWQAFRDDRGNLLRVLGTCRDYTDAELLAPAKST